MSGPERTIDPALAEVRARRLVYPVGSGEAEEIALAAGLKPLVRQLLDQDLVEATRARFEQAGFVVAVANVRYAGRGGKRRSFGVDDAPADAQAPVFVGRDRAVAEAAAACELERWDVQAQPMGALLGYPPCCVEAFATTPAPRPNRELAARALARTAGRPNPRLNTLDQAVFHYVPYSPCSLDCAPSLAYADAVAQLVRGRHPAFAAGVDASLAAHRLMVTDDVQVSLTGAVSGEAVEVGRVWPTAIDRHPRASLPGDAERAVASLVAALRAGRWVRSTAAGVELDGRPVEGAPGAILVPFGR